MPQMKLQINYASAILASGIGFVLALQTFHWRIMATQRTWNDAMKTLIHFNFIKFSLIKLGFLL